MVVWYVICLLLRGANECDEGIIMDNRYPRDALCEGMDKTLPTKSFVDGVCETSRNV